MVKVEDFTVQLVAVDTNEPFKEHTAPDGQVYAEVEPDMDYFIAVRSDVGGVKMEFHVDGVDLGYYSDFLQSDGSTYYEGSSERNGGRETMTALRFYKTRQDKGAAAQSTMLGKVEVKIFHWDRSFTQSPMTSPLHHWTLIPYWVEKNPLKLRPVDPNHSIALRKIMLPHVRSSITIMESIYKLSH